MTNPVALPKPPSPKPNAASSPAPAVQYYEGNVQLLEARFVELCASIRALHRSVEELREYCKAEENNPDHVIVEAIFENLGVMKKQRRELEEVVRQMKALHADTDVPDDIRILVLGDDEAAGGNEPAGNVEESSNDAGVYL